MVDFAKMIERKSAGVIVPPEGYPAMKRSVAPRLRNTTPFTIGPAGVYPAGLLLSSRPLSPGVDGIDDDAWAMNQRRRARVVATSTAKTPSGDIWRDSLLRYAGYANEVGESFRNIAPRAVVPSCGSSLAVRGTQENCCREDAYAAIGKMSWYAVSIAYVCGDTVDKAYKKHSAGKDYAAVAKMGVDVLLWQMLASVAVPGLTINFAVKGVTALMEGNMARQLPRVARKWTPTFVALGIIPLIVTPIDEAVTSAMDDTVRIWLHTGKPKEE